uniref:Uncharacterized protein n=1 Tax=viral metagenome TaxID=1070528 RepID=A0A6C0IE64_9ZZZZ
MPSLDNTTDGYNSGHPRRQYITTSAFHNDIYRYTTSLSSTTFVVTGTLTSLASVGTATAANCPANRILRENGRRLNKDANPGVSTLLLGVYDSVSGLSGFIDPNSPRFALYNGDKSVFQDNGVDPNGGLTDQGPPIFTRGTVTAGSGLTVTSGGATITAGGLTISAGGVTQKVTASAVALGTTATLDLSLGNVFYFSTIMTNSQATAFTVTNGAIGSIFYVALQAAATPSTVSFTGSTGSSVIYVSGPVVFTAANPTFSPTLTASTRYLFVGTIVAA